jgi:hypothetical protein
VPQSTTLPCANKYIQILKLFDESAKMETQHNKSMITNITKLERLYSLIQYKKIASNILWCLLCLKKNMDNEMKISASLSHIKHKKISGSAYGVHENS